MEGKENAIFRLPQNPKHKNESEEKSMLEKRFCLKCSLRHYGFKHNKNKVCPACGSPVIVIQEKVTRREILGAGIVM
jgi:rRNA maturation endonuclease Nob1